MRKTHSRRKPRKTSRKKTPKRMKSSRKPKPRRKRPYVRRSRSTSRSRPRLQPPRPPSKTRTRKISKDKAFLNKLTEAYVRSGKLGIHVDKATGKRYAYNMDLRRAGRPVHLISMDD